MALSLSVSQEFLDMRERQIKMQAQIEELTVALGKVMGALAHIHDTHMSKSPSSDTKFGENLMEKKPQ